jgi:hypothetical protein
MRGIAPAAAIIMIVLFGTLALAVVISSSGNGLDFLNLTSNETNATQAICACGETQCGSCVVGDIPKYCENGNLVDKCLDCGCAHDSCRQDGSCGVVSCMPANCASLGRECGKISDGCNRTLSCGSCEVNHYCNSTGQCSDLCMDECKNNSIRCLNTTTLQTCVLRDSGCLEWGGEANCPSSQACNIATAQCQIPDQTCSDGTLNGDCSSTKPMYCSSGNLISNCSKCGCGTGSCQDEVCVELNKIQPVIYFANDTDIDVNSYISYVDGSFQAVRSWYSDQLGGKTFNLQPSIVYRSSMTEQQLSDQYGTGEGVWINGIKQAAAANGMSECNSHTFYYFVTPLDNTVGGWVGAEHLGCSYVLVGTASIPSHMGRLVGGIIESGWPEWWADEIREAQGGVAHEIAHGLGGYCDGPNTPGNCDGMAHSEPGQNTIMFEWWNFGIDAIFNETQKAQILASPFIY